MEESSSRVLLVVGGSSDIGVALIKEVSVRYDTILIHYNHLRSEIEELIRVDSKYIGIQADLSVEDGSDELVEKVMSTGYIPTDIVHLPAIPYKQKKFHKISWSQIQAELNVSLKSAIVVMQTFLPYMSKEHFGRIVIMLSMVINGMPPKHNSDYVIIKESLYGLVKACAVEYADQGITINGISPALVKTKFVDGMHDYIVEQNAKQSPTGENLQVGDVIPTIQFLLSDGAKSINGQNILITCGR